MLRFVRLALPRAVWYFNQVSIIIIPHFVVYISLRWWQVPYFWMGIKTYDLISGSRLVKSSYYVSKSKALEEFPMLKDDRLCGAIVYYDGKQQILVQFHYCTQRTPVKSNMCGLGLCAFGDELQCVN